VTISLTQGNLTTITSGLNPGDSVVTDGQDKLQTGSTIEPRSSGNPGNSTGGQNSGSAGKPSGNPASGTSASGTQAP
jgi:multidrug efflux system membrane fusion protein